jgi:hypothetical protein
MESVLMELVCAISGSLNQIVQLHIRLVVDACTGIVLRQLTTPNPSACVMQLTQEIIVLRMIQPLILVRHSISAMDKASAWMDRVSAELDLVEAIAAQFSQLDAKTSVPGREFVIRPPIPACAMPSGPEKIVLFLVAQLEKMEQFVQGLEFVFLSFPVSWGALACLTCFLEVLAKMVIVLTRRAVGTELVPKALGCGQSCASAKKDGFRKEQPSVTLNHLCWQ